MVLLCECVERDLVMYNVDIKEVKCVFEYDWKFCEFMVVKVENCVLVFEEELIVCIVKKFEI